MRLPIYILTDIYLKFRAFGLSAGLLFGYMNALQVRSFVSIIEFLVIVGQDYITIIIVPRYYRYDNRSWEGDTLKFPS